MNAFNRKRRAMAGRAAGLLAAVLWAWVLPVTAASFVHPGMLQTRPELELMRQKVAAGEEPWKTAWSNLCAEPYSALEFQPKPVAHVIRGPYGRPSIGDKDLMDSANAAYSQALQWVITGDKVHAQKAMAILNAWSRVLWDFEGNDAKLLAGWTGHNFCNAAEILRHTDSGWQDREVDQFKRMLLTVYYPLIRDYFPEANGNWDAAMMDTTLCIGIFCDDRAIFNQAVEHFLRGEGNAGITKYVYPSGQCEETTRDQGHTQLGLGELAQACQVAWNQHADLYGSADNRLALGIEYTAKYMLGGEVPAYGVVSAQGRDRLSDIYEGIYQHYHFDRGLDLPFTEQAVAKTRLEKSWTALTLFQGPSAKPPVAAGSLSASRCAAGAGAESSPSQSASGRVVRVGVGESIQAALDASAGGGTVVLAKGIFILPASLRIPSGVALCGQGMDTTLVLDPEFTGNHAGAAALVNAEENMHDITLRDFVLEGGISPVAPKTGPGGGSLTRHPDPNSQRQQRAWSLAPSRAGIIFNAQSEGQMRDLHFEHLTVRNCTHDGVAIRGAAQVTITGCDFSDNGSSVVPGPGLQDNLLLSHVTECLVNNCRLDDSPWGSGVEISFGANLTVTNNEVARNARHGIYLAESREVQVSSNLLEGNNRDGMAVEALMEGCRAVEISGNQIRNNGDSGVAVDHTIGGSVQDNLTTDNGTRPQIIVTESKGVKH